MELVPGGGPEADISNSDTHRQPSCNPRERTHFGWLEGRIRRVLPQADGPALLPRVKPPALKRCRNAGMGSTLQRPACQFSPSFPRRRDVPLRPAGTCSAGPGGPAIDERATRKDNSPCDCPPLTPPRFGTHFRSMYNRWQAEFYRGHIQYTVMLLSPISNPMLLPMDIGYRAGPCRWPRLWRTGKVRR